MKHESPHVLNDLKTTLHRTTQQTIKIHKRHSKENKATNQRLSYQDVASLLALAVDRSVPTGDRKSNSHHLKYKEQNFPIKIILGEFQYC
jgi:hypothetical protein